MKILIVSQYYYPEQFQINEIAPELVRRGHDVTVLTGLPNYPKGETYPGYGVGEENINGVRVIRTKLHPRKSGALHLGWNYISFVYHAGKVAKNMQEKYDELVKIRRESDPSFDETSHFFPLYRG